MTYSMKKRFLHTLFMGILLCGSGANAMDDQGKTAIAFELRDGVLTTESGLKGKLAAYGLNPSNWLALASIAWALLTDYKTNYQVRQAVYDVYYGDNDGKKISSTEFYERLYKLRPDLIPAVMTIANATYNVNEPMSALCKTLHDKGHPLYVVSSMSELQLPYLKAQNTKVQALLNNFVQADDPLLLQMKMQKDIVHGLMRSAVKNKDQAVATKRDPEFYADFMKRNNTNLQGKLVLLVARNEVMRTVAEEKGMTGVAFSTVEKLQEDLKEKGILK